MTYIWGKITREAAEEAIAPVEDGKFLLRVRDAQKFPDDYVLCVGFKGKPTHHLVTKDNDGSYTINKKSFGNYTAVEQLIAHLGEIRAGWPVALQKPVYKPGVKKASAKRSKDGSVKKGKPGWLYGPLSKEEAEAVMTAGGLENGRFLVRSRAGKKTDYVLGVVYKGKPTHHLIVKDLEQGCYVINKKKYGDFKTCRKLIEYLMTPNVPKWPVQLINPYNRADMGDNEAAPERPTAKKPGVAPEPESEPEPEPEPEPTPSAAPESIPPAAATTAPEPAAPAAPNIEMVRVLCRAVVNIGTKMHALEAQVTGFNQQLTQLEQFALQARQQAQALAAMSLANAMSMPLSPAAGRSMA